MKDHLGYQGKSRPHRRRRARVGGPAIIVTVALLAGVVCVLSFGGKAAGRIAPETKSRGDIQLPEIATSPAEGDSDSAPRPVYRYSVIPGGVYSARELAHALNTDTVARAHHATVAIHRVHVETVAQPRQVYVSYRLDDRIYWTKNRVRLAPGESILTDGAVEIRARCGNGISTIPMTPTSDREPVPVEEWDGPVDLPGSPSDVVLYPAPALRPPNFPWTLDGPVPSSLDFPELGPLPLFFPVISEGPWTISESTDVPALLEELPQGPQLPYDGLPIPPVVGPNDGDPGDDTSEGDAGNSDEDPSPTPPPVSVPEPGALLMVGLGTAAVFAGRLGRRRQ